MNKKTAGKLSIIVAIIAVFIIGGTFSYFTDEDEVTNKLELGDLEVSIREPEWEDEDGEDLEPGDTKEKDPLITAVRNDMYFRIVMTLEEVEDDGMNGKKRGDVITDTKRLELIKKTLYLDSAYTWPDPQEVNLKAGESYSMEDLEDLMTAAKIYPITNPDLFEFDSAASTEPGVYYYNYVGGTGAKKGILEQDQKVYFMSHVVIPSDWGSEEFKTMKGFHVSFKVEAIQAKGFTNVTDAIAALKEEIAKLEDNN